MQLAPHYNQDETDWLFEGAHQQFGENHEKRPFAFSVTYEQFLRRPLQMPDAKLEQLS